MRCERCNSEMRIWTERVGTEKNGIPIFHRCAYCDNCKMKKDLDAKQTNKKNGDSVLSIISCVFSGAAFILYLPVIISIPMFFIGFLIGLIDIGINNKEKRHLGSYVAIVLSILGFIVYAI